MTKNPLNPAESSAPMGEYNRNSILFDKNPLPMWVVDLQTYQFLKVNQAAVAHFGYSTAEFMSMTIQDILPPGGKGRLAGINGNTLVQDSNRWLLLRKDGSICHVEVNVQTIEDRGQKVALMVANDVTAHAQYEERLRYQAYLLEHVSDAIVSTDANFVIKSWNKGAEKMFGYLAPEIIGKSSKDAFAFEYVDVSRDTAIQQLKQVGKWEGEVIVTNKRGHRIHTSASASAIKNEKGEIRGYLTVNHDITDRKLTEKALQESEEDYRLIFNGVQDAILVESLDGKILAVNDQACEMYGYSNAEFLKKTVFDLVPKGQLILMSDSLSSKPLETLNRRSNGEIFPIEISGRVQTIGGKKVLLTIVRDITDRRQVEAQLKLQATALDSAANAIVITDRDGNIQWLNQAFTTLTGYTVQECLGKNPRDLVRSGKHDDAFFKSLWDTILAGKEWRGEIVNRRKDGSLYTEEQTITPVMDKDGQIINFVAVKQDVTDRRRSEMALRDKEKLLSEAQRIGQIGSWSYDLSTDVIQFSDYTYHLLDISPDGFEHSADGFLKLVYSEDKQGVSEWMNEIQMGKQPKELECRIVRKDSELRHLFIQGAFVYNGSQKPVRFTGTVQNVTERKKAEIATLRHMNELEALYENGLSISRLLDPHEIGNRIIETFEHYLSWHHVTIRLRKGDSDELELVAFNIPALKKEDRVEAYRKFSTRIHKVGQGLSGWVIQTGSPVRTGNVHTYPQYVNMHPEIQSGMYMPLKIGDRTIGCISVESELVDAFTPQDERLLATLANQAAVAFENSHLYQTIRQELIERKRAEKLLESERNSLAKHIEERTADLSRANAKLARALRVKDEFLANMSHELRTPLNAILGLSESLLEQIAGPVNEKQQKYITTINESGRHLLSLINDILDLAKIEAGQITLNISPIDVQSLCQASLRMIKQLAQKKFQEVSLEIDDRFGVIWADERHLKQMTVNLLSNAVKFTPDYGKIGLRVFGQPDENKVDIMVWDTGIGIAEEDLAKLFHPFVQLDSGLDRQVQGTGLGLSLVSKMARLHGGSVSVNSQVGKGSQFTISLPWRPASSETATEKRKKTDRLPAITLSNNGNKPTILLIEDTKEAIMLIKDYLELSGFKVATAEDGVEGVEQAQRIRPDLILMDIQIPRLNGFEATKRLRSDPKFEHTPIIALTALAMQNDRERCLAAGMDEYISKPINLKAMMNIIQNFLPKEKENEQS